MKEEFLPSIYFDSSVLIDYYRTAGMDTLETEKEKIFEENKFPHQDFVQKLLKSKKHIKKVLDIRKKNKK